MIVPFNLYLPLSSSSLHTYSPRFHSFSLPLSISLSWEQYENEACLLGHWGTTALTRPHWSDSRGKIKQPKEAFEPPPPGWTWYGDWFLQPELSTMYNLDDNRDEWQEEVYENQARYPLSSWPEGHKSYWTNVVRLILYNVSCIAAQGRILSLQSAECVLCVCVYACQTNDPVKEFDGKDEKELTRDEIKCPEGWLWKEDWQIDIDRAIDDKGMSIIYFASFGPYHVFIPYLPFSHSLFPSQGGSMPSRLEWETGYHTRGMGTCSDAAGGCVFVSKTETSKHSRSRRYMYTRNPQACSKALL